MKVIEESRMHILCNSKFIRRVISFKGHDITIIVDCTNGGEYKSVTNVIEDIHNKFSIGGYTTRSSKELVLYRDTNSVWDGWFTCCGNNEFISLNSTESHFPIPKMLNALLIKAKLKGFQ